MLARWNSESGGRTWQTLHPDKWELRAQCPSGVGPRSCVLGAWMENAVLGSRASGNRHASRKHEKQGLGQALGTREEPPAIASKRCVFGGWVRTGITRHGCRPSLCPPPLGTESVCPPPLAEPGSAGRARAGPEAVRGRWARAAAERGGGRGGEDVSADGPAGSRCAVSTRAQAAPGARSGVGAERRTTRNPGAGWARGGGLNRCVAFCVASGKYGLGGSGRHQSGAWCIVDSDSTGPTGP